MSKCNDFLQSKSYFWRPGWEYSFSHFQLNSNFKRRDWVKHFEEYHRKAFPCLNTFKCLNIHIQKTSPPRLEICYVDWTCRRLPTGLRRSSCDCSSISFRQNVAHRIALVGKWAKSQFKRTATSFRTDQHLSKELGLLIGMPNWILGRPLLCARERSRSSLTLGSSLGSQNQLDIDSTSLSVESFCTAYVLLVSWKLHRTFKPTNTHLQIQ